MKQEQWSALKIEQVIRDLKTDKSKGLSSQEATRRFEQWGPNQILKQKRASWLSIFISQFKSTLIYILLVAAAISFILNDQIDAWVILVAVIFNVIVGFIQEFRAEKALEALQRIVTFTASVIRDGQEMALPPSALVPGDIVKLHAGSKVPADVRLFATEQLMINEAMLTGESVPQKKNHDVQPKAIVLAEQMNMAFFGTIVVGGSGVGVVVSTGSHTEIGKIAELLAQTPVEQTPLQERLRRFSQTIAFIILGISLALFIAGILLGRGFLEMFTTSVALAVAAIPEGLVVVMTAILALGMQRILKQNALVRKLVAAETLGSTTVICTDKTGTLTIGEMHVVRVISDGFDLAIDQHPGHTAHPESVFKAFRYALLNSDAYLENQQDPFHTWRVFGNPTERALVTAAAKIGLVKATEEKERPRIDAIPFDSERKYMVTLHRDDGKRLVIVKGAPERMLNHSTHVDTDNRVRALTPDDHKRLQKEYRTLSSDGLRMLAIAYKHVEKDQTLSTIDPLADLIFLGFFCMQDPLREDARAMIQRTAAAGIRTVMLTGDNAYTALAIAKQLGLPSHESNIIDGERLEKLSKEELDQRITDFTIYARVTPKDKLRIIDAWQHKGHVVAMTGDGVNDSPALRSADIGIALGSGTDVAKETASMILLKNDFSVIVRAIEEGRVIFANIKKVVLYLMSDSFTEMVLISGSLLLGMPLPLLASQILWINLISDGLPALALTFEPKEANVMEDKPIKRRDPIFTKQMRNTIMAVSLVTGLGALLLFYLIWKVTGDIDRARTITFLAVSLDSLVYVLSVRVLRRPIWRQNPFSNMWLVGSIVITLLIQISAVYLPFFRKVLRTETLVGSDWFIILSFILLGTLTFEIMKDLHNKRHPGSML